jgi:GTP cyclohydrolase II
MEKIEVAENVLKNLTPEAIALLAKKTEKLEDGEEAQLSIKLKLVKIGRMYNIDGNYAASKTSRAKEDIEPVAVDPDQPSLPGAEDGN